MKKVDFARMLFGSFLALLLVLPGAAAANDVVAEVENLGDTLVFHPVVPFAELILTVTGPCNLEYRQRVTEGEPFFRLDPTTIDGMYRFELTVIPSIDPGIVKILQQARQSGDNSEVNQLCRDGQLPGDPAVQASGFRVFEGRILFDPGAFEKAFRGDRDVTVDDLLAMVDEEAPVSKAPPVRNGRIPTKDFVINDDLIVDGSACIGFDCVNGESFGFDTIRLKENNLRIKFDDTSTAASFPRNDWQLTANDSANGGASKFSIDDISGSRTPFTIEANARSHSLYVDDGGRIGSRTSTPSVEIHTIDGDTPTLRLQQDGSSGFAPQTWDVAGNETNFFVRDVTNGSTLPLRIRPGAPSSSIFIDVDGDVGMGTSSPNAPLHVLLGGTSFSFNASTSIGIQNNAASGNGVIFSMIGGNGTGGNSQLAFGDTDSEFQGRIIYDHGALDSFRFFTNGALAMTLNNSTDTNLIDMANGAVLTAGGVWTDASSRELKQNISSLSLEEAASALGGLSPVTYSYKVAPDETYVGFIAEDVPELVATASRKGLAPMDIVAVLTKVVQHQQKLFDSQHSQMEQQQETILQLMARLSQLEARLGN